MQSLNQKLKSNIYSSFLEKGGMVFTQFISALLLIRFLSIEAYGLIGIAAGYFALLNFINIALENILLRDHKKLENRIDQILYSLFVLNVLKGLFIFVFFSLISPFISSFLGEKDLFWAFVVMGAPLITDCLVAPFNVYATLQFKQSLVTKMTLIRQLLNITSLFGLIYFPSLFFLACKELCLSLIYLLLITYQYSKAFNISPFKNGRKKGVDWLFLKESCLSYSLWTHFVGVTTFFMYRADTFFLSFFVSAQAIGYYSIALNSANVANILPQILAYQNGVAISHLKDKRDVFSMTNRFVRLSIYLGTFSFLAFVLFGKFYLTFLMGKETPIEVYYYMLCIALGLILVKTFVSPYNSYINVKGDVYKMFLRVVLPSGIFTFAIYFLAAAFFQTWGIAIANIFVALFWLTLQLIEMRRYGYSVKGVICFKRIEGWS